MPPNRAARLFLSVVAPVFLCAHIGGMCGPSAPFALQASVDELTLARGRQETVDVRIDYVRATEGGVELEAFFLPSGVRASFDPNPVPFLDGVTTTTLTLEASPTAATAEERLISIVATGDGAEDALGLRVSVGR